MALIKIVDLTGLPIRNFSEDGTTLLEKRIDQWETLNGLGIFLYSIGNAQVVLFENGVVMVIPGSVDMVHRMRKQVS